MRLLIRAHKSTGTKKHYSVTVMTTAPNCPSHAADVDSLMNCLKEGATVASRSTMGGGAANQAELNEWFIRALDALIECSRLTSEKTAEIDNWLSEESERLACLAASFQTANGAGSSAVEANRMESLTSRLCECEAQLEQTLRRLRDAEASVKTLESRLEACEARLPCAGSVLSETGYLEFENRFRGPRNEIKKRQSQYAHLFHGRKMVLDLGCGRGEFLRLMQECGVPALGVDVSRRMVDECLAAGAEAYCADVFDYMASIGSDAVDGVFCSQVIEHMTPAQIWRMVSLCYDKLAAGGVIVVETVNPSCPAALGEFFLDPTHVRPVPARMLTFLMAQAGFDHAVYRFSAATSGACPVTLEFTEGWPEEVRFYQDYAAIAVKPSGPSPLAAADDEAPGKA